MKIYKKNHLFGILIIFIVFCYFLGAISIILNINNSLFIFSNPSFLSIFSLITFISILILVQINQKYFYFFLPFVLVAFPNIINDLFPSFYMGPLLKESKVAFSFITHIDIFLIWGLISYKKSINNEIPNRIIIYLLSITYCFILFFIFTIVTSKSAINISLFSMGSYQIRYLLLFLLYFLKYKITTDKLKYIIYGIICSILFLLFESVIFSTVNNTGRLYSGNLAANVYANFIAAVGLFFIFIDQKTYSLNNIYFGLLRFLMIIICVTIIILNGTRMAFLSLLVAGILYYLFKMQNDRKLKIIFKKLIYYGFIFSTIIFVMMQFERFSSFIDIILTFSFDNFNYNEHTASIFTRISLFKVSIEMFCDNIFIGVAPGRWNFLKYEYGFHSIGNLLPFTLFDPHNDYLSYLSQYGLFGIILIVLIFIYPIINLIKQFNNPYAYFGIFSLAFAISGITNANTLKHPISAFMYLTIIIVLQCYRYQEKIT